MANTKKITLDYSQTGITAYCIIRREADGYLLNDATGSFASAPADPYISMTEDGTIKGRYEKSESRSAWDDGLYTVAVYKQAGGSPSPVADTVIGSGEIVISNDSEVYEDVFISSRLAAADYTAPDNAGIAALPTLAEMLAGGVAKESTLTAIQTDITSLLTHSIAMSKWKNNKLAKTGAVGAVETWVLYDDDSVTPLLTWSHDTSTSARAKAV